MVDHMRVRPVFLFMFIILVLSLVKISSSSPAAKLFVDPMRTDVNAGESFSALVKIVDAYDIYSMELRLGWSTSILNVTSWKEGDFLSQGGIRNTFPGCKVYNDKGYLLFSNTLLGVGTGSFGSGTIANITFTVKSAGETGLHLYGVGLADSFINPVFSFTLEDGYVNVAPPMFSVEPVSVIDPTLKAGSSFSVNITLTDVVEARGFLFRLQFNQTLLNVTDAAIVPFLSEPVLSDVVTNNTKGFVQFNATSTASDTVSKSGLVANVTFMVRTLGRTPLELNITTLNDKLANLRSPTPFEHHPPVQNGYFDNIPPAEHDIEVSKATAFPKVVKSGGLVSINATLKNLGANNETFNVITYYTVTDIIENRSNVVLLVAEKKILEFTWDTTGVAAGTYTIKVEAKVAQDEKLTNNAATIGPITIEAEQSTSDLYLYVAAGAAIVVVVALVLYFVVFRKKS